MESKAALESDSEVALATALNSLGVSTPDQGYVIDSRDAARDTVSSTVSSSVASSAPHNTPGAYQQVCTCM